jgi:hypothetical protein
MSADTYTSKKRRPVKTNIYKYVKEFVDFLLSDKSPERTLPIMVGALMPQQSTPHILYNCEQMTREDKPWFEVVLRSKLPDVAEVWDYSLINVELLKKAGIRAKYVPLQTTDENLARFRSYREQHPPTDDVGFCGCLGPRRNAILSALRAAGLSVPNLQQTFGEARDNALAKCHVMINIHYRDDYKVWESCRCQVWLDLGVPVISENSLDNHPGCINVPYDKLVEETIRQVQLAKAKLNSSG